MPPLGHDGREATRWTDPGVAKAYALREDEADRRNVWPALEDAVRPAEPRRVSGRPDGTVLDLGCGLGALAQRLADRHWLRVYAFDVSPTMHRLGAARYRDAWVLRTLPDLRGRIPLRRAQCTAAIAVRVLLHLEHPLLVAGLLTDARRVLRRGAPLAIVEPDRRSTAGASANDEGASECAPYVEHYRLRDGSTLPTTAWRYSPATIADCLTRAGFELDEIRPLPRDPDGDALLLYRATAVARPM